ncbi:hypothetical protein SRB5_14750 [Streptomyces sp. RB5]|uniref:Uncharacterized protein n=1 Tax=Streptomyces smaragdinus TaxID=2585196 RepID=A0A7K0CD19_9ACTN|nr:DUF6191 domain-containing protein [Streptomyces smaragdinus]MQY11359.1 hypothetical protein [Streptomyces smaragdinus]
MLLASATVVGALWVLLFLLVARRRRTARGAGAAYLQVLDEVFHPSGRQVQEQRERQSQLRDDEGDGAPPRHSTVDLDAGRAVIRP